MLESDDMNFESCKTLVSLQNTNFPCSIHDRVMQFWVKVSLPLSLTKYHDMKICPLLN